MSGEHEHELRAVTEDLEVVICLDDLETVSPSLKEALAEFADALVAEQVGALRGEDDEDEVAGFSADGLKIGSLDIGGSRATSLAWRDGCWFFSEDGSGGYQLQGQSCVGYDMRK